MTANNDKPLSRQQLAHLAGMRDSTIKFYSERGLLPFVQEGKGLARRYNADIALPRLREILELKERGLNVEQIVRRFPI